MTRRFALLPAPPPVDLTARGAWTPDPDRDAWLAAHPLPVRRRPLPLGEDVDWGEAVVPVFVRDRDAGPGREDP